MGYLKLKYTVKITFTNGDVEHYMSEHTDITKLLPPNEVEEVQFIEISPNKSIDVVTSHKLVCKSTLILLEELNDILSKGELENDEHLDSIIYQCKILIDHTSE